MEGPQQLSELQRVADGGPPALVLPCACVLLLSCCVLSCPAVCWPAVCLRACLEKNVCVRVQGTGATVLDTRKTVPGLRLLDKWAVAIGGGANHRMGLYDMAMIKDNHIAAAGGIGAAVAGAEARL